MLSAFTKLLSALALLGLCVYGYGVIFGAWVAPDHIVDGAVILILANLWANELRTDGK